MEGTLENVAGTWQLRFTRTLAHPPEKVWRALTDPEHLAAWFPTTIEGERKAGASLRFRFPDAMVESVREARTADSEAEFDDSGLASGEMTACDPFTLLEFTWGGDTLRFELEPQGKKTILKFTDTFAPVGKGARDAAGWHACLDVLEYHLDGQPAPWDPAERWAHVHNIYTARFPAEATTIGPPPTR